MLELTNRPHRRRNALTGEWVLVSPHRNARPWQGHVDHHSGAVVPQHDPGCYMCPGNARANGERNPAYESVFVFTNDFPALMPETPEAAIAERDLLVATAERGISRVVCFSPRHDLTLSMMDRPAIRQVVDVWAGERSTLAAQSFINYVQIFENRGALMGASNPHPHGQIWATSSIPNEIAKEDACQHAHLDRSGRDLLGDYIDLELDRRERLVLSNDAFVALVPFWAVWPYESLILPRRLVSSIDAFTGDERDALADLLKRLLTRYDRLFDSPAAYSLGFHESPADGRAHPAWRWHGHIYPPMLRSATVRKFMVGFELLAMPQRDITAEQAAERLRSTPEE